MFEPQTFLSVECNKPTEKAATVEYAQLEDKGHQMPNTSTAAIPLKNTPLFRKGLLSLGL